MRCAVIISANIEWESIKPLYPEAVMGQYAYGEYFQAQLEGLPLIFFHAGWGKTASAGALQWILDHQQPDLVINVGTCGGIVGQVERGDIVLVERTFIYDIVELMDIADVSDYYASTLDLSWLAEPDPFPVRRGLVASADADLLPNKVAFLKTKGALAADWESASLAWVAQKNNARLLILRGVSDMVDEEGGEVYKQIAMFRERTQTIMNRLIDQLPGWVRAVRS